MIGVLETSSRTGKNQKKSQQFIPITILDEVVNHTLNSFFSTYFREILPFSDVFTLKNIC